MSDRSLFRFLAHSVATLLLEKLNELDLDVEADLCEKLHDDAEHLFCTLTARLDALQDG
ncbi:Rop family plasmid primer RNA-binding protein, partial [Klebsiella pneumoniae]|uniref:Rop family plasmid primer RNA-binding protein n=1 Tax=Klebsiella pneumoniae TaxID=573 RepID=UPI003EE12FD8